MSRIFTKPMLAVIKSSLAELYTHAELPNLFETYDFEINPDSLFSNKLERVAAYLDHQDWHDVKVSFKMLELLSQVYTENGQLINSEYSSNAIYAMTKMHQVLENNAIKWNGKSCIHLTASQISKLEVFQDFDAKNIHLEVDRARENIEKDPADAMTAAENIFVATCKKILHDENVSYGKSDTPMEMLQHVLKVLSILPDDISTASKGGEAAKKTIRSMGAAIQGLGELRNLYGDSHGKDPKFRGIEARHARLMVGFSEALSIFLVETYIKKPKS